MKKLYKRNELIFALIMIVLYLSLMGIVNLISDYFDIKELFSTIFCGAVTVFFCLFIIKNNLSEKYGLCKAEPIGKGNLYYIPLLLIATSNLWFGFKLNRTVQETVLRIICMLFIGFIEEILFRGFLFKALIKFNIKAAVLISSVSFAAIHLLNVVLGADPVGAILQTCYAAALGFMFAVIFYKGKSLLPCIITHSMINSLSVVADSEVYFSSLPFHIFHTTFICVVSLGYGFYVLKQNKQTTQP